METKKQNKLLKIAALILLLANIGTITTIWITRPTQIKQKRMLYKKQDCDKKIGERHYFIEKLDLSDEQARIFKESKRAHMKRMHFLKDSIRNNKQLIHAELFKQASDTLVINQLTKNIGALNSKFEELTYQHFMDIKLMLEPNQVDRFKELIKEVTLKPSKRHGRKVKKQRKE